MSTREICPICGNDYSEFTIKPGLIDFYPDSIWFSNNFCPPGLKDRVVCSSCLTIAEDLVEKRFLGVNFQPYHYIEALYSELDKMGA